MRFTTKDPQPALKVSLDEPDDSGCVYITLEGGWVIACLENGCITLADDLPDDIGIQLDKAGRIKVVK